MLSQTLAVSMGLSISSPSQPEDSTNMKLEDIKVGRTFQSRSFLGVLKIKNRNHQFISTTHDPSSLTPLSHSSDPSGPVPATQGNHGPTLINTKRGHRKSRNIWLVRKGPTMCSWAWLYFERKNNNKVQPILLAFSYSFLLLGMNYQSQRID